MLNVFMVYFFSCSRYESSFFSFSIDLVSLINTYYDRLILPEMQNDCSKKPKRTIDLHMSNVSINPSYIYSCKKIRGNDQCILQFFTFFSD